MIARYIVSIASCCVFACIAGCGHSRSAASQDGGNNGVDGGGSGSGLPTCSGTPLSSSGVLDVAIAAVHVTGAVTLAGGTLPAAPTGSLVFEEQASAQALTIPLAPTYDVELVPGTYTILYAGSGNSSCAGPLPCNTGAVKTSVTITSDGVLDLDISAITVTGQITLNGGALQNASGGALSFTLAGSSPVDIDLATSFSATLVPGAYVVGFVGVGGSCAGPLPCNSGPILTGVNLSTSGVLDVDIPAVSVTGQATLNAAPLPASSQGKLTFSLDGGSASQVTLAPSYAVTLLRGTYTVGYAGPSRSCTTAVPCNAGPLETDIALMTSGVLDLDIPSVQVTGAVTLAGAALPSASDGALTFALAGGGSADVALASNYSVALLPGSYTVGFSNAAGSTTCDGSLPCGAGPIKTSVSLTTSGVLDLDIPVVHVDGAITLAGAALPSGSGSQSLSFSLAGGGAASVALSSSYSVTLLPGTYTVGFNGNPTACDGPLPCNTGPLKTDIALDADGVLDIDLPVVSVNGNVTLAGMAFPDTTMSRGTIGFALVGGGTATSSNFGTSGPTSYSVAILPGNYIVVYDGDPKLCPPGSQPGLPCMNEIVKGCP